MTARILPTTFRGRFLLVVAFAAVVPLALVGVWLTRSVARAGEELLRSELEQSIQQFADAIELRWMYRDGELALLANNEVGRRLLASGRGTGIAVADSAYLKDLFGGLSHAIPQVEYRNAGGAVVWSSAPSLPDSADRRNQPPTSQSAPALTRTLLIGDSTDQQARGTLVARINLSAVMPSDTSLRLPNGAKLQIVERDRRVPLLPQFTSETLLARERFVSNGDDWLSVHRSLAGPGVDLMLAAPLAAYVQPFQEAANTGVITLAIASVFALLLSAYLATRLTRSLERLAIAAEAVAAGDLEQRVDPTGGDEVGRVGTAFNTMIVNLRRTLGELSNRQALAVVGEYAASLSHEVRNGLSAVRVDLQRAEEKIPRDVQGRPLVGRALENVRRLDGIVSDSLRAARRRRVPKRRLDLHVILRSAQEHAESAFSERGASLIPTRMNSGPVWVMGDAGALEQLFVNLLVNAAQAVDSGGRAAIDANQDGPEVCVLVTDTGVGIAPEDVEYVLDPFYSTKQNGTGLGLSIARQIAVSHGGSLRLASTLGEGTRVEVRLPLAAAPS